MPTAAGDRGAADRGCAASTSCSPPERCRFTPGQPGLPIAIRCRRAVFETVLRSQASAESRVTLIHAQATGVAHQRGRAIAVRLGGDRILPADLVLDTSGRAGRLSRSLRAAAPESAGAGSPYVSPRYRLRRGASGRTHDCAPGAGNGLSRKPGGRISHDNRTFSTLIARSSTDRDLAGLRGLAASRPPPGPSHLWQSRRTRVAAADHTVLRGGHWATATAGSGMMPAGSPCRGSSLSATRCAPPMPSLGAASRRRSAGSTARRSP